MKRFWILKGFKILALTAVAVTVFGYVVMSLWNWVVPSVTGLQSVTFVQALALLVLSRILFGGFRGHGGGWHWRHRMRERWENMTPEERERLRETLGSRCRTRGARPGSAPEDPARERTGG
jgi:hypothetical protein